MNRTLYFSLAKNNIKNNRNTFFPFLLSSIAMIALNYMISAICVSVKESEGFYGDATLYVVLSLGVWICGIFAVCVIFYANAFLMKQRARELGLYGILGMEKRHIAKVLFWEMLILGVVGILAGLFFGILFSRLMFLLLLKLMGLNAVIPFGIPVSAVVRTVLTFGLAFGVNVLRNCMKARFLKPIELLGSGRQGEREPKARWLQALLAVAFLAVGYVISITTENPIKAFGMFFVAVLFVMAGTYLLFLSGSIAILKLLKKNKNFYYHKTHFISVSGMMYRMKRNAVGLANICILSTAALVAFSTTVSLYAGVDDFLKASYPKDVITTYYYDTESGIEKKAQIGEDTEGRFDEGKVERTVLAHAERHGVTVKDAVLYYSMFFTIRETERNAFEPELRRESIEDSVMTKVISMEDYSRNLTEEERLAPLSEGQVYAYDTEGELSDGDEILFCGMEYQVKLLPEQWIEGEVEQAELLQGYSSLEREFRCMLLFLPDRQALEGLADRRNVEKGREEWSSLRQLECRYLFDVDGKEGDITEFCGSLRDALNEADIPHVARVGDVFTERGYYDGMCAGLLFVGLFAGVIFLMATALIIYYKQVSEGYEDRERFQILQKVGMDQKEVKKIITTQILQVFFLPLALASVHIAFAFPIIRRLLSIMGLMNVNLFIGCTAGSILVFTLVYGIVYYLTARTYYRIVYQKDLRIQIWGQPSS